ncbi:uncharacterized protein FFFS_07359 [Fusarium fujikuroi]|nr:uncharacterized protein FFFS_07359 [Fusarium fujikuroi]
MPSHVCKRKWRKLADWYAALLESRFKLQVQEIE